MIPSPPVVDEPLFDRFAIWGTSVVLGMAGGTELDEARRILDAVLAEVEQAASRFREGTEILELNARAGSGPLPCSPMLLDLVACALVADRDTEGACDPTVADALLALGYDRDIDAIETDAGPVSAVAAPGTAGIVLDRAAGTIDLPAGTQLDLGATAKARAADIAAATIAEQLGVGVLVDIGGDLSTAGQPPAGGWQVGISREARTGSLDEVSEVISVSAGSVASSSSAVRTWQRAGQTMHHVVDPATGLPAETPWAMVTVAAGSCTLANSLSTAAIVWGEDALFELPQRGVAARLERHDGSVERIGGWPEPSEGPR